MALYAEFAETYFMALQFFINTTYTEGLIIVFNMSFFSKTIGITGIVIAQTITTMHSFSKSEC